MSRFKNNFDFLRFLFAICVIITHSFALLGIPENEEWLMEFTNHQLSFSAVGLAGFFTISGYFIYISLMRSDHVLVYLKKRILRIFPGLFVVLLLSLVMVAIIYSGKVPLLRNLTYLTYLPYNMSLYGFQGPIDGVFENLHYKSINGSLWTIRYEFSLYLGLIALFFIRNKKAVKWAVTSIVYMLMIAAYQSNYLQAHDRQLFQIRGIHFFNLGTFFIAGALLAQLNFKNWKHGKLILITSLGIILSLYFEFYNMVKHLLFPLLILSLGFYPVQFLQRFSNYGDASYGIYIYSFPIQQLLVYYLSPDLVTLIILSVFLAVSFGYISWHLVEKRALRLK